MIAWEKLTKEDCEKINKIAIRASGIAGNIDAVSLDMDLTACQVGDSPLDLNKLLAFDDFNFAHDIGGISRHMNRETGKLEDCFVPRCAV